jgi:hypothetical protein
MTETERLRPVERRVLRLAEDGLDDQEIARRFGRGAPWAAQVRFLAGLDRQGPPATRDRILPLERRVLRWRREGADHDELSDRFRRSPEFLARVEHYAHYKLATG